MMADVFTQKKRSEIMRNIRSKNTTEERIVASILRALKLRYKANDKSLPGTPDFSFPKRHKVVFVNGCFWHGHRACSRMTMPKSNASFWIKKIEVNKKRDRLSQSALKKLGWRYLVLWQCQIHGVRARFTEKRLKKFLIS
jgi:DNA mismatch endonuclease (patch repair protein)